MSKTIGTVQPRQIAAITPQFAQTRVDRTFQLPNGLYAATVGLYLAFLAVMSIAFMNPELFLPMVVIAGFIVFGFGLAGEWAKMRPTNDSEPLTQGQFRNRGISTASGQLTSREATVQVLILPVLILVWGISIAIIAAAVR